MHFDFFLRLRIITRLGILARLLTAFGGSEGDLVEPNDIRYVGRTADDVIETCRQIGDFSLEGPHRGNGDSACLVYILAIKRHYVALLIAGTNGFVLFGRDRIEGNGYVLVGCKHLYIEADGEVHLRAIMEDESRFGVDGVDAGSRA